MVRVDLCVVEGSICRGCVLWIYNLPAICLQLNSISELLEAIAA